MGSVIELAEYRAVRARHPLLHELKCPFCDHQGGVQQLDSGLWACGRCYSEWIGPRPESPNDLDRAS